MAILANSTPAPERPLLPLSGAFAAKRLPRGYDAELEPDPHSGLPPRGAPPRQSELLAILNAGPIAPTDLAHLSRQKQKRAEAGIAALIDLLDALDGDPDLEDGGDTEPNCCDFGTYGANDECEGDNSDDEPSLGAPEVEFDASNGRIVRHGHIDQRCWSDGSSTVHEDEPTLGAREASAFDRFWPAQRDWAAGHDANVAHEECEQVSEDEGAQCEDEGACIQSQPHDPEPDEHSLGSLDRMLDQSRWAEGSDPWNYGDLELEDEHGSDVMEGEAVYA